MRWILLSLMGLLLSLPSGCGGSNKTDPDPDAGCLGDERHRVAFGEEDLTFHVGPHLEHTTQTTVAISWESLDAGGTRVEYGADSSYGLVAQGESGTMHQLVLEGLEPGTEYHYRACTDERCTGDLVLATAPPPVRPFRFAVYGDCQDNPDIHRQVAAQVMADEAAMVVVVGDTVSDGSIREQYKERFYDPARALSHSIPRYAAVGNHDRKDREVAAFRDYHIFPEDPDVPQAETSYTFTYGDAFFLVLDNTIDHFDFFFPLAEGVNPPLWLWLLERAASPEAQSATWRFAFAHYPADSICREEDYVYGMPESAVREYVLPALKENGFQGYFAGHVHCYERFDFDGLLVITTAGGGGGLDDEAICTRELPESRFQRCLHHHTLVELGCGAAQVWARDIDGNLIEHLELYPDGSHQVVE